MKLKVILCALIASITISAQQPIAKQSAEAEALWKQFKQRIALMQELKQKSKAETAKRPLPPAPTFRSQSEIHLNYFFGRVKHLINISILAWNMARLKLVGQEPP